MSKTLAKAQSEFDSLPEPTLKEADEFAVKAISGYMYIMDESDKADEYDPKAMEIEILKRMKTLVRKTIKAVNDYAREMEKREAEENESK